MESLHNHTTFSDGRNTPRDLVEKAVAAGLKTLAITDHYEYLNGFYGKKPDIGVYFVVLKHLKKSYAGKIRILSGLEINFQLCEEADLPLEFLDNLDFVLFEHLAGYDDFKKLAKFKRLMHPLRVGLAHPDFKDVSDFRKLVDFLEENDIFVELNTSCYMYYGKDAPLLFETQEKFFKLLKNRSVKITVGTDSHRSDDVVESIDRAYDFIEKLGLGNNLLRF